MCSVSTVMSQTCPRYTAGFAGDSALDSSSNGGIYVNDAPAHRAPCDGTVYAWHYCYYPENTKNLLDIAFGVYEHRSADDQFIFRPESYYFLHLDTRESFFTCETITLSPSQYFQIYHGDRVGACLRNSRFEFLDILATNAPSNFAVVMLGANSGSCEVTDMSLLTEGLQRESRAVLHLYVDISKKKSICN